MRNMTRTWVSRAAVATGAVLLIVVVAACGKAVNANATTTASPAASPSATASASATAAVTANWQEFFSGATPAERKMALVQQGQQFAQTIKAQAGSAIAQSTEAKVTSVTITSPTTATVTYSITMGGQTALPDQKGKAVLEGGVWKVSAKSFADLLKLEQGGASGASPMAP
jgi:hypothetical protein